MEVHVSSNKFQGFLFKTNIKVTNMHTGPLALWVVCLPMAQEARVQSLIESYQRLRKIILDISLHPQLHRHVVANEKGIFVSPLTTIASFSSVQLNWSRK